MDIVVENFKKGEIELPHTISEMKRMAFATPLNHWEDNSTKKRYNKSCRYTCRCRVLARSKNNYGENVDTLRIKFFI